MDLKELLSKLNPLSWSRPVQLVALGAGLGAAAWVLLSSGC